MAKRKDNECGRYNVDAVMSRIPELMGLELVWRKDAWEGRYYINGDRHPYKKDKLKVKVWGGNGKPNIYIYEQGGQVLSLQSWLIAYGGATDYSHAMSIIYRNERPTFNMRPFRPISSNVVNYISSAEFEKFKEYDLNRCNLFTFMCRLFGESAVRSVWERYNVTTDDKGNVCYFYVDPEGRICHDKVLSYRCDGHRDKRFTFRRFKTADGYSARCFFGSHLIEEGGECHVVESEKSCLLAALMYPDKIWLATGGKNQLRDVDSSMVLYPDCDCIDEWSAIDGARICEWWLGENELGDHDDIGDLIVRKVMGNYYVGRYR